MAKVLHTLKIIFSWIRSVVLALFITYWLILIFFVVEKFVSGGPTEVMRGLEHIELRPIARGDGFYFPTWSWTRFAAQNITILIITLTLSYFERRSRQKRKSHQIQAP